MRRLRFSRPIVRTGTFWKVTTCYLLIFCEENGSAGSATRNVAVVGTQHYPWTVTTVPSQKVTWVLFFGTLLAVYVVAWRYA